MRVGQLGEGVGVPGHRLAALGVELGDAVRLDVLLAVEAQLLLHGQLDRQAVAVPAGLAGDVVAAHRPEAGEDVLEDAGLDVVGAGHAVGGRRALVEDPLGPALGLLEGAGEDLAAPARSRARRARGRAGRPGRAPGGTGAAIIGDFLRRTPARRFRRRDESRRAPAVPPSLAACSAPTAPSLGSRCRFYSRRAVRGLSSGGSGVIFTSRTPPGSTVPGSLAGCVRRYSSHPCLSLRPSVRGRGRQRPTGFPGCAGGPGRGRYGDDPNADRRGRSGPAGPVARQRSGAASPARITRAASGAQRWRPALPPGRARADRAACPVAAWPCGDLSFRSRFANKITYVKGSRPWWRKRPPREEHDACRRRPVAKKTCGEEGRSEEGRGQEDGGRRRPRRRRRRPKKAAPKKARREEDGGEEDRGQEDRGRKKTAKKARGQEGRGAREEDGSQEGGGEEDRGRDGHGTRRRLRGAHGPGGRGAGRAGRTARRGPLDAGGGRRGADRTA